MQFKISKTRISMVSSSSDSVATSPMSPVAHTRPLQEDQLHGEDTEQQIEKLKSHMEKQQIEKFKRYEVECRRYLMSKYFSDKTIFGGNIFDVKMTKGGETTKVSRFPGYQSYADPANYNEIGNQEEEPALKCKRGSDTTPVDIDQLFAESHLAEQMRSLTRPLCIPSSSEKFIPEDISVFENFSSLIPGHSPGAMGSSPIPEQGTSSTRSITPEVPSEINFLSTSISLANYLKPLISPRDQEKTDEVSLECLLNESMHFAAKINVVLLEALRRTVDERAKVSSDHDLLLKRVSALEAELTQANHEKETYRREVSHFHSELADLKGKCIAQLDTIDACAKRESELEDEVRALRSDLQEKNEEQIKLEAKLAKVQDQSSTHAKAVKDLDESLVLMKDENNQLKGVSERIQGELSTEKDRLLFGKNYYMWSTRRKTLEESKKGISDIDTQIFKSHALENKAWENIPSPKNLDDSSDDDFGIPDINTQISTTLDLENKALYDSSDDFELNDIFC